MLACACDRPADGVDAGASDSSVPRDAPADAAEPWLPEAPERIRVDEDVVCPPLENVGLAQPAPSEEGGFPRLLWTYVLGSAPEDAAVLNALPGGSMSTPRELGLVETPGGDVMAWLDPVGTLVVDAAGAHRVTWPTRYGTRDMTLPVAIGAGRATIRNASEVLVQEIGPPGPTVLWRETLPGAPALVATGSNPAVSSGGAMYVVAGEDRLASMCASDGTFRWEVRYDASRRLGRREVFVAPDGNVWFTTDGPEIYRFASDGELLGRGGADLFVRDPTPSSPYAIRDGLGYMPGCGFYVQSSQSSDALDLDVELWSDAIERVAIWPSARDDRDRPATIFAFPTVDCGLIRVVLESHALGRLEYLERDGTVRWFTTDREHSSNAIRRFTTADDGVLMAGDWGRDGFLLVLFDALGRVVWDTRIPIADLEGLYVENPTLTLGRSGILYGATPRTLFAIATGVRPAPSLGRNIPSASVQHQGSNPSRTGSSEPAWFEVAGE